jgi:hypothetical protein
MSGDAMADKPDGKRWGAFAFAAPIAGSIVMAYMGAYYATETWDTGDGHCFVLSRTYKVGGQELPAWSHDFFSAANWIDDALHSLVRRHR